MTRTVRDSAILLGALTGIDPRDSATAASQGNFDTDYTQFLDPGGLEGARIGVTGDLTGFHKRVRALFEESVENIRANGASLVDPANLPNTDKYDGTDLGEVVNGYEFKAGIKAYLESLGSNVPAKNLADLIEFNEQNRDREMPFFEQERFIRAEARGPLTDAVYQNALRTIQRYTREEGIDELMNQHNLDAIIAPTVAPAWLTDHVNGDRFDGGFSGGAAAIAGYPHITLPMGFFSGLPVAFPSLDGHGANRRCSGSPTHTSRQRTIDRHQSTSRRWVEVQCESQGVQSVRNPDDELAVHKD